MSKQKLLVVHMFKATHLDHPNELLSLHLVKLKLVGGVHDQTIENTMKMTQWKSVN
jgi:hypothetical protein